MFLYILVQIHAGEVIKLSNIMQDIYVGTSISIVTAVNTFLYVVDYCESASAVYVCPY